MLEIYFCELMTNARCRADFSVKPLSANATARVVRVRVSCLSFVNSFVKSQSYRCHTQAIYNFHAGACLLECTSVIFVAGNGVACENYEARLKYRSV